MENKKLLLDIQDLTIHYITESGNVHAVENLNLTLEHGENLGFVGETGAGKTTTALGIMGLVPNPPGKVMGGKILFEGEDLLKKSERQMRDIRGGKIAMIFQDPMTSLNPVVTVGIQISEALVAHQNLSEAEAEKKAMEMLEKVQIPGQRYREYPHEFSGGMRQRVVIAMALACNPGLIIADEPTTALDVTIQAQVLDLMRSLKEEFSTAMIMITHDLGVVGEVCDHVAVMYAGRIVETGSLEQIFGNARHPYTLGLFRCIPDIEEETSKIRPIEGLMPDPLDLPSGCPFHPRCPQCMDVCRTVVPGVLDDGGHRVMCHLYGKGGAAHA